MRQRQGAAGACRTCVLLILLFGKYRVYVQLRLGSHMMSSQRFLPRASRMGRDEKSSSHTFAPGV